MDKPISVLQFFEQFPDNDTCLQHLMNTRYGETLDCPHCGKHGKFHRRKERPIYQCQWCAHQISPMAGTPFERSRTALVKWFYAMYLFTTSRHGVPAKELQRQLSVTYKTAWRMGHEIRKYMDRVNNGGGSNHSITDNDPGTADNRPKADNNVNGHIGYLSGHVEVDETYIGGSGKGMGKKGSGRSTKRKTAVFGMLERGGDVITKIVPNAKTETLLPIILDTVDKSSTISSDEWRTYRLLPREGYQHGVVKHSKNNYVNGIFHVNGLEGFWSRIKNSIRGTHIHVSKKHLAKYLGEFEFRYNMRSKPEMMFERLLQSF